MRKKDGSQMTEYFGFGKWNTACDKLGRIEVGKKMENGVWERFSTAINAVF
jgi:hypothetical protein